MLMRGVVFAVLLLFLAGCSHGRSHASFRVNGERGIGPALDFADIAPGSVRAVRDPNTGAPVVVLDLTRSGVREFNALTRNLARRGAALHRQLHVLISVDGRVVTRPYIDYRLFPNGLPGNNGIEINGLPSMKAARRLAKELNG